MDILSLEVYSAVINIILMVTVFFDKSHSKQSRIFKIMLLSNFVILYMDILSYVFVENKGILYITYFFTFAVVYIFPVMFSWYIFAIISEYATVPRYLYTIVVVMSIVSIVLALFLLFSGLYINIDDIEGTVHLGDMYILSQIVPMILVLYLIAVIIIFSKKMDLKTTVALISYVILPVITLFVQTNSTNDNTYIFVALTLSMLIIFISVVTKENIKARERESELAEAKIQLVISQIRPHFIFNTLNAISYLCATDPECAEETVAIFAQYLRGNLDFSSEKKFIPFSSELGHIKAYLHIEKLRFGERINVVYNIECDSFTLPSLSIQPIVENAVKHGICKKESGGTITITSHKINSYYEIIVEDDGIGFDINKDKKDGKTHIGIDNVEKRLEMMCSGTLSIKSTVGKGTKAIVRIPVKKHWVIK